VQSKLKISKDTLSQKSQFEVVWELCIHFSGLKSACKLEEHSQQGPAKDGNHLGGSGGGSSKQIRMASECGPLGCGLN